MNLSSLFLLQNKKRKVSALLALSELNDAEKAAKKVKKSFRKVEDRDLPGSSLELF